MRILLVTQYYHPEPAAHLRALAQELSQRGHSVEVLTSFPCYPQGSIYPGHRQRLVARECIDGIGVIRIPQIPDHSRSFVRRALYYLSYAVSAALLGPWVVAKPDVILAYQSALPLGFGALMIGFLRRAPVVLDVVDLWPESVAASGMSGNRGILRVLRLGASLLYRLANHICVVTQGYADNLKKHGVPADKLSLIYYWNPQLRSIAANEVHAADQVPCGNHLNVMYAGNLGPCQHLQTVLQAASLLRADSQIQFYLIGDGTERASLVDLARSLDLQNVHFINRQSPEAMPAFYRRADLLLVHLKPDEMSEVSIPSKTYDYIAHGKPVLMAVQGEASRLTHDHGFGVVVPPCDPQAMAQVIRELAHCPERLESMSQAAAQAFRTNFCPAVQVARMEQVLLTAAGPASGRGIYRRYGKRLMDATIAALALVLCSPLLALLALLVRLRIGSPVLFQQQRPGLNGRVFTVFKFRTMTNSRDAQGRLLSDAERLTPFGRWLRSTSLDELPELWNVLQGTMSLIGPRPLLLQYLERYSPEQARRHEVRPGITGWAQVNGRNAISWEEKFRLDVWYVDHCCVSVDLWILLLTAWRVVRRDGVTAAGHATAPEFLGSDSCKAA